MSNGKITVLADETLGGVLREYKQVERNAEKGEKIEIIAIHPGSTKNGYVNVGGVFTADIVDSDGAIWSAFERDFRGIISSNWEGVREYVVLEPTDVVQIDGLRYAMVARKASVGERVVVTDIAYKHTEDETLQVGQVGVCTKILGGFFEGSIDTNLDHDDDGYLNHERVEYSVLVPLIEVPQIVHADDSPHSLRKDLDNLERGVAEDVAELRERIAELEAQVLASKVPAEPIAPKSPQQIRDEIVERAKADVSSLGALGGDKYETLPRTNSLWNDFYSVEFVVAREKRTVVAILRPKRGNQFVLTTGVFRSITGKSKAAPNDVFNAHIGKAIALRRALGLEVPAEYLSVPNPTEVRVGDIVQDNHGSGPVHAIRPTHRTVGRGAGREFSSADKGLTYIKSNGFEWWTGLAVIKIIDDTREGSEQSVSSTKGVAA